MATYLSEETELPGGFAVAFELDVETSYLQAEWSPNVPRRWAPRLLRAYRRARNTFLAGVAQHLRGNIVVMELGPQASGRAEAN